jgi:hypothetical protein
MVMKNKKDTYPMSRSRSMKGLVGKENNHYLRRPSQRRAEFQLEQKGEENFWRIHDYSKHRLGKSELTLI